MFALMIGALLSFHFHSLVVSAALMALVIPSGFFFSDTMREVAGRSRGILAPVDGVVTHRRECFDPVLHREAIRISIRLHWWGGYCVRAPIEGAIVPATGTRAPVSRIQTDEGDDVLIVVRSGLSFGANPISASVGERVGQGRRCGVRRLIREIDLILPERSRVEVSVGQTVKSGQTVVATLLRKT